MKQVIFKSILVLAATALVLTGCRKKDDQDNDTSGSSDNALAERTYSDVHNIADEAAVSTSLSSYRGGDGLLSACATITHDSLNNADLDTITVDFGTVNCMCADGRNRRGKIICTYLGRYKDSASTHTITFNNYFVNDNGVGGSKTVTNLGHIGGNLNWSVSVNGSITLANGGGTITWTSQRTRVMTAGESTGIWSDDIYSITGSANGTSAAGNNFTATITSALIKKMNCRHIVQGTFDFDPGNGKPLRTVDFGTGTCDDVATVTINGNTYTIQLR